VHNIFRLHTFLPPGKTAPDREQPTWMLVVRFTRRATAWAEMKSTPIVVFCKNYNAVIGSKFFINEDLIPSRRKLFGEARSALKAKKIAGAWTASGMIHVENIVR
jgi:hypothetical protein